VIIVDASAVIAASDRTDRNSAAARAAMASARVPLIVPAPVSAEIDYMLERRLNRLSRLQFLIDVQRGRFRIECLELADYTTILNLEERYAGMNPGLADLSLVVLAARFKTTTLLTFDERHFRNIEPLQGGRFTLLPIDA